MKCFIVRNKPKGTILFLKTNTKKIKIHKLKISYFNKRREAMENMKRKQIYDVVSEQNYKRNMRK